ncbi:hypothetical protein [Brucella intermedia]|uniref:hypothetical protein n=1 Tax=Brucella intermedia TaxID=94625 RepID=UPI00124EC19A|nr:hypothetical protein [Brucella intermedia]KAB2721493.1 hypothetical protein F9L02_23095 [Brucella intermedia]
MTIGEKLSPELISSLTETFKTEEGDINLLALTGDIYAGTYTDIHTESHKEEKSYLGGLLGSTHISNSTQEISTGIEALALRRCNHT